MPVQGLEHPLSVKAKVMYTCILTCGVKFSPSVMCIEIAEAFAGLKSPVFELPKSRLSSVRSVNTSRTDETREW